MRWPDSSTAAPESRGCRESFRRDMHADAAREDLLRLGAIERDRTNRRIGIEQAEGISFGTSDSATDAAVEAAGPLAMLEHVPDADTGRVKARDALGVRQFRTRAVQLAHERPEEIVRMRIRLAHLERTKARHRARARSRRHPAPTCGGKLATFVGMRTLCTTRAEGARSRDWFVAAPQSNDAGLREPGIVALR